MIGEIGALVLVSLAVTSALPSCLCPRDFKPVCGSNGQTYNNECLLRCIGDEVEVLKQGACEQVSIVDSPNSCICPYIYSPVCGSDGKTYGNSCELKCEQNRNPNVAMNHKGACDVVKVVDQSCVVCPLDEDPVCGTDGITYGNECAFNCAPNRKPDVTIKQRGRCQEEIVEKPCICTLDYKPVCGTDGTTYSNECNLNCARGRNNDIVLKHVGACEMPNCACTRNFKPVCGTDGQTYNNMCLLNCAKSSKSDLGVAKEGPCESLNDVEHASQDTCGCVRNLRPVCGTDGQTYSNPCQLNCAREKNEDLHILREGFCKD